MTLNISLKKMREFVGAPIANALSSDMIYFSTILNFFIDTCEVELSSITNKSMR